MKKGILLTATILGSLFVSAQAVAGASANIGATSNYVWRGVEQANGSGAFFGGLDYEADNGLYAGAWASTLESNGEEVDLYAGYAKELSNGVGYDVGVISYQYPTLDTHAEEVTLKGSYGIVEAGIAYGVSDVNEGDLYYHAGVSKELANGITLGGVVGKQTFDAAPANDYNHYQVSAGWKDFTLAADDTDVAGSDPIYSVSWGKSFDF